MESEPQVSHGSENEVSSYVDWLGIKEPTDRRQFIARMGKSLLVLGAAGAIPTILAACSSGSTPTGTLAASSSQSGAVASGTPAKQYRVAFIIFVNNPYWEETRDQVNKILKPRLATQGVTVDLVNATASANAVDMASAIDSAVAQKYDGIIVAGIASSMDPAIKRATDKGVPVFTFCCDVPTSTRVAFYGPNNYNIGKDAATLMAQGLTKENILSKRSLSSGVVGIETALGVSSLVDRANGFRDNWKTVGIPNVTLLEYIDAQDDAKLVYSKARDTISANPNLVGLYVACGSQYQLGNAIIEAGKVGQVIGIAHEVFAPTLQVMQKGGLWGVTNDAPIGQVVPPGDAMTTLLLTGTKPAQVVNDSAAGIVTYWVYATDTAWITAELQHWDQLTNDCTDGCPALIKAEMGL
jgi:ABC-type sugar transport system substrate-binding protein